MVRASRISAKPAHTLSRWSARNGLGAMIIALVIPHSALACWKPNGTRRRPRPGFCGFGAVFLSATSASSITVRCQDSRGGMARHAAARCSPPRPYASWRGLGWVRSAGLVVFQTRGFSCRWQYRRSPPEEKPQVSERRRALRYALNPILRAQHAAARCAPTSDADDKHISAAVHSTRNSRGILHAL
jgi:hypothetical protein